MQLTNIINAILANVDRAIKARETHVKLVQQARAALAGRSVEEVRETLLPLIAAYRKVPVIDGKGKAQGTKVFDRTAAQFESAKRDLRMLTQDIVGEASPDKGASAPTKIRIKADERAAALALLEACGGDMKRALAVLKAVA